MFFGPIGKTRWPPWPLIGWDIFDFSSETAERNSTKLDRKQDLNVLYQVFVFRANWKTKMAALASDWLRHFRLLLWNRWTEFNETWQEARSQRPLPSLCFSGRSEKQDGRPGLWLAETFSTSSLKPLNGIQRNLTGSKISTSSTKFVFFGPIGKTRWPPWPLIGWDIFDFSSETAERNSTKLDRKQDLNVLYQVCVFRADRKKQDGRPGQSAKKVAHCTEMSKSVGHAGKSDKICSCPTKVTQIPVQMSDVFLKRRFRQMRQSIESWPLECFIFPTLYYKASNWLGIGWDQNTETAPKHRNGRINTKRHRTPLIYSLI